ncbi:hypothetical protein ACVWYN_002688 [Pedobacter sp. UYP24]
MIELKLALRAIDKMDYRDGTESFSIVFLTADRTRKTGGEMIVLESANKCGLPPGCKDHEMRGIKDNETGKRYAIHNRLIFQFNKQDIYWV